MITPQKQIDYKRDLAELLARQAGDTSPVQHWTQGLGRLADGYNARKMRGEVKDMDLANQLAQKRQAEKYSPLVGANGLEKEFLQDNPEMMKGLIAQKLAGKGHHEKPTALIQNLMAAGLQPGTAEFKDAILGGTKRGMVINNQMPGAEKGTNKLTEKLAEQAAGVFDQAASAQDLANKYSQINEYAQDPNVRTGTLGAFELGIKKLGNTVFGLDFEGLPEAEQIQKVGDLLVGDIRKMQGDTRMSDADRKAYRAIPPNIGDSKQGIMLATEIMQKTARGMAARQKALSDLVAKNGGLFDTNVWAQYNQYINQNPILTRDDVMRARSIAKGAKQNTPGAGMKFDQLKSKYGLE